MRVALVDDNKNDLALLHEYISEQTAHSCQIDTFSSGESFLSCWQMGAYDLVVLDIFMGKMTGIEVAEKLRKQTKTCISHSALQATSLQAKATTSTPATIFASPFRLTK